MRDLAHDVAAKDRALARLEDALDSARTGPDDLSNVVALLYINVRAQNEVLRSLVEHIRWLADGVAGRPSHE